MKKIFGFGKKREKQQSPSRPASGGATASPSGGEGGSLSGGGYEVWRSKDLGKLHRAAATGDLKKLQQLVRKHDLNQLDKANRTPLHLACASGNTDIVMFLVDNRCKLNLCDDDAKSPLMKAVQCQHELCATYLLEHGADTNLVDANGNTALHLAASNASISIAHRLIEHNARVDVQNKDGSTPLTIAITEDNHIMAEFLLKNGADIHFRDNAGRTPLLTAASHGKHNLVKLLLLHGADASHKDCNGWSAEDYALISGDPSLSQKIAEYANCRSGEKSSTGSKKDLSVFNSPDKAGDAGFTLGAPATNKEVVDDHSSDDSIRGSGKTDDSWRSSEGEELDFSPKKLQKPSLAQLMNVSQQLKKINIETGNNRPSKENFKAGAQISVHPNQQELKDQSDSLASNEEEEYEEGEEEEEESGDDDEEEEEEEEEAVEEDGESEMEDDFSEEREDENIVEEEESQGKIENEEEEYFNSGEREELSEMCVDNEHEAGGNHANTNISSSNNDICSVEEMQGTGHMPVSFIAGKYECSNENGAISKVNNELPNHSSERVNNNEAKEVNEFQNHEIPHECQESVVCSLETFEATALTKAALASPLKNNNDNGRNSNLSDSFESNDDHGSEVELEKCKARQQNSKSPVLVNYQDGRGKQYMDPEELQNAIYEPLVQKSENIEEENPKEIIPPNSKEDSSEEDEEKGDREEEMGNVLNKKLKKYDSKAQNLLKDDIVRKAALASEADEEEDDKDTESPWDSECISESPRKPSVGFLPTSPSKVRSHMHSISEEARNGKSDDLLPETTEANVDHVGSYTPLVMGTETREKQKSDLMEKLGLDDADDIEDESDWDSTSVSLKSVPSGKPFNILILEEHESPLQLRTSDAATKTSEVFPVGPEELPGSQVIIALEDKVACIHADLNSRILAVPGDVPQQPSSPIVVHYSQLVQPEEVDKVPSSVQEATCALDPCSSWLVKSAREGIGQQSNEEAIKETESDENEIYRTVDVNDFDDITQSSDTATEDVELPSSVFRDTTILIEQLSLDKKDSVNLLKFQNIFHGYERLIEHEKERYTRLLEKVKKRESEKREQQRLLKEMGEMKSVLDHQKAERERDISSLKFSLKQEEEKRMSAEMLYEKKQEQSRKKEKQYCKEMEEKQQLELMLRSLEMELRTLKNHLEEVDEERRDTQRQLAQEQNARALQEGILNTYLWKRKEMEEESKKIVSKSSETADNHDQEKELWHKNKILENELSVLKLELDHSRVRHQEEEANYLEENDILKEKVEELKKDLKLNEEALTQTVAQYSGQLNASKAECAMLISKLEFVKENKERLQVELDSFRSRLSSSTQELERCQLSRTDLERMLQREHDDWLRLKDKLNHDLCNLQETNNAMSQQLSKAESKGNSLESELHHVTHALREKNLLLESIQRDLSQAQCQVKELENARQVEKDQINKYAVKQDSLQERLAHLQSENILLRQQFEDLQNKGIIKEKVVTDVQDKFNDIFSKLRADFEKQVQLMEERNKELVNKCNNLREQTFKYEAEKAEREGALRQLQQELADSLKKQSMSEASLEVTTRYRSDLEDDKRQLQKEIDRIKSKLQESEEQYIQSERHIHDLRSALNAKEHETSVECQKLQDLLVVSSERNNTIKQLEEHIQRLEVENARLEATTKQQTGRIEILQKDLQDSVSVHHRLEELITSLQTSKINLEEQLSHQVQKQNMLSETAQGIHSVWEEQLKSRSKLGIRVSELDTEKLELMSHLEDERKKVKKLLELKQSVEMRLDQETTRNNELQKECIGTKKLLKAAKKKLKDCENGECSSQTRFQEVEKRYVGTEVEKLRTKVDELSHQLDIKSTRCTQLESTNHDLQEQLSSLKLVHKSNEKLKKRNQQLEEEVANLQRYLQGNLIEHHQIEKYKRDIEERARQDVRKKLEEVNMFLQTQAASQEALEQIRTSNNATVRNQLEHRIRELESELARERSSKQDNLFRESNHTELEQYKALYSEEQKMRKSLGSKLDRANERLAEANAKILYERQRSRSLFASSFVSGSLSASPVLGTVQLGNLGSNVALNRSLSLGRGFISPTANALPSKNRAEAYLAKMQTQLEKNITKELDQATAELDATSVRVSPLGSIDESSKT
ncbi:ankyrin repeat domain-containing protein 26-like isoform X8 [Hemicordylus capensis]|uniref:ankyrin repeat domain-containing protein 26-like isoform X8 n=1 Tax=Hemicordylus capensis TaxID=884348 RepID=UPI0023037A6B|nr:ankyrin repeat domain-containing protein 26-like isoform X8 [Hemicordylus capensis]